MKECFKVDIVCHDISHSSAKTTETKKKGSSCELPSFGVLGVKN